MKEFVLWMQKCFFAAVQSELCHAKDRNYYGDEYAYCTELLFPISDNINCVGVK